MSDCPCGSGQPEARCCGPFLDGAPAPTAEALMRSRYTAYARGAIDYLMATHAGSNAAERAAIEKWSKESRWQSLEILHTERGGAGDEDGVVEFIARGLSGGKPFAHHERSRFRRTDGRWLYVDGDRPKPAPARREATPGRNDPCPCGSGKKYKKCHGAA